MTDDAPVPPTPPRPPVKPIVPPAIPQKAAVPVRPVAVPPVAVPPVAVPAVAVPPVAVPPVVRSGVPPVAVPPVAPRATPAATPPVVPKPIAVPPMAVPPPPAVTPRPLRGKDPAETSAAVAIPKAPPRAAPTDAVVPTRVEEPRRPAGPAALAPGAKDPHIGTMVGRCKILERIGQGKTAVVYRAENVSLGLPVAVKILHPSILEFPDLVAKFEAEARAIAKLDHPNVLKIYDVLTEGDVHAIVMELLVGESVLDLLVREKSLEPLDALRIVRQSAAGLEAAHAKGIIHRDVKPQNLVIMPDGTVKLVDFGLATATNDDAAKAVRIGTPHYMAPEVCEATSVEPKSDVYSLGITLFHLLTGQPPYAGQTVKQIMASHIEARPLEPERRRMGLAKPIAELVRAMTKRDALTRMSVADVIATVDRIGGEELKADLKLRVGRGRRRRGANKSVPTVAILIGALVLVGGLVALLVSGKDKPEAPPLRRDPVADPTDPGAGVPPVVPPTPPPPPTPPVETEAERTAREAEQAKKEAAARLRQSRMELDDATAFARLQWEDKGAVIERYKRVARSFGDLEAGKEAKRRAEGIAKGEIHPHPDRVYAPKTAVEKAREAWAKLRGDVDDAMTNFRYDDALRLVPSAVEDPEGKLAEEVEFFRRVTLDLVAFRTSLDSALDGMKPEAKDIALGKGTARVRRVRPSGVTVDKGPEASELPWAEVPLDEICALAKRAFEGKDPATSTQLATFAWTHRLRQRFFETYLKLKSAAAMTGVSDPQVEKLASRASERMQPK